MARKMSGDAGLLIAFLLFYLGGFLACYFSFGGNGGER
jgi:hypothetical protein